MKKYHWTERTGEKNIYILIGSVILIGGIVPFAAQFICPFFFPEREITGAAVWNQYVSIILGVIATITSVVSLVLGFRNERENYDTERRTRELLHDIKEKVIVLSTKQDVFNGIKNINGDFLNTSSINIKRDDAKTNVEDEQIN